MAAHYSTLIPYIDPADEHERRNQHPHALVADDAPADWPVRVDAVYPDGVHTQTDGRIVYLATPESA